MLEKASFAIAIIAILVSGAGIAYTASAISSVSSQLDQTRSQLSQIGNQVSQVNSKFSPLENSVNSAQQEQAAIRSLVEQRVGGLEKTLQEAQQRLAEAERKAQESSKELEALRADQALEEAAKKENAPLIYGNIDAPDFANVVWPRFRETYPWAPANGRYIEGFTPLRSRFVQEYQANAPSADIVWQSVAPMLGEIAPYLQPFPDMKYKNLYDVTIYPSVDNPLVYSTHILPRILIYNSNILKDEDAPTGWYDMANPKWKGKLVMQDIRRLETTTEVAADLLPVMGQERWEAWLRGLAANQPVFTGSNTEAYVKVVAGEFPVGFGLINDIVAQKPGNPVKIAWPKEEPKGVPLGPSSAMGISKKATNPNFAKLFMNWLLSPLGQKALAETGRPPALVTVDHPNAVGKLIPAGVKLIPPNQEFRQTPNMFDPILKSIFG